MKINVFMSGGTGFFGKSLLSMLKREHYPELEFTVLSRNPQAFLCQNPELASLAQVRFVTGDVRDFVFPEGHFDWIIHAGAPAMAMPPGVERDIILRGTERMLDFARLCKIKKFLFISSGGVYGIQPSELSHIPENFPCHPTTEYGIAKFEAEQMCLYSGIPVVIARCFAFTGPYLNRNIHFAIGNFIRDALANIPIIIKGDGRPYRSYLFADDLIKWLIKILQCGENGEIYNVGSDQAISISELALTVKQILHSSSEIIIQGHTTDTNQPAPRYIPDIGKIRRELGVNIETDLNSAILNSSGNF